MFKFNPRGAEKEVEVGLRLCGISGANGMRGPLRTTSDYTCSRGIAKRAWTIFIRCLIALQLPVAAGCNSKRDVKTVGGLKKAAEAGNRTYFNYDGAVGSIGSAGVTTGTTYEYWDTIEYGPPGNKVRAWSSDVVCDSSEWEDVTTTNGGGTATTCATSPESCQYKDKITNLVTTKVISTAFAWNTALSTCAGSTYGGFAAGTWRLPTQKELMSMYEHGITSICLKSVDFMMLAKMQTDFWSSSTNSNFTTYAWYVYLAYGYTLHYYQANTNFLVCVR